MVSTGIGMSVAGCSSSGDSSTETTSTTDVTTTTQQTTHTTERTTTTTTEYTDTATTTDHTNSATTATHTTDRQTTNKSLTLGATATFENGLEGTVEKFQLKSEYESGGTTQSSDQTFLFVEFTVANPTDSRKEIPLGMSIYVTVGGKRYDPIDSKGAVRSLYTSGSVEGGATRSGTLIFEVPQETSRSDVIAFLEYSGSDGTVTSQWTSE
jgi:hypothetical protein